MLGEVHAIDQQRHQRKATQFAAHQVRQFTLGAVDEPLAHRALADAAYGHRFRQRWTCPDLVDGVGEKARRRTSMPGTHPPYSKEYRRRIVELARAGRSVNELAREFEPSASAIRYWLTQ